MNTPIRLISLTLKNFMSYGNSPTTINLEFKEPTLIIGRNLDAMVNGQVDSNGSGKTTIINALAWGLYGKPISKISQDGLVNNINRKDMEVTVTFEKDEIFYQIFRYRKHSEYGDAGIKLFEAKTLEQLSSSKNKKKQPEEKAESSINLVNKQIERIIDMPYDIFTRIVIYSARHDPFFSLPTTSAAGKTNQADIMEELTGLTDLSRKGDLINEELKSNSRELESLKKVQEEIDRQKLQFQEKLDNVKTRISQWDIVNNNNIFSIQEKIKALSNVNFELQREYLKEYSLLQQEEKSLNSENDKLKLEIDNLEDQMRRADSWITNHDFKIEDAEITLRTFDDIDYDNEEKQLQLLTQEEIKLNHTKEIYTKLKSDRKLNLVRLDELNKEINHLKENKCPYCLQQFTNALSKINELEVELDTVELNIVELTTNVNNLQTDIDKNTLIIIDIKTGLRFPTMADLNTSKNLFIKAKDKLEMIKNQTNPFADINIDKSFIQLKILRDSQKILDMKYNKIKKKLSVLKQELQYNDSALLESDSYKLVSYKEELIKLNESVNPHLETLNDIKTMEFDDDNYKKIDKLEYLVLHQKFLYKLFTHKSSFIRKSLLNKSIKFLNEKLKEYLDMLGLPHKVRFTEELAASISQFGNVLDYDNLSSGQQARVNLALSFAFRDVLQKRYGKISFCILDECLDVGLGGVGVQMAAKMIKTLAVKDSLSMFIISHRDEIANLFPKAMEIELDKGFSKIIKC